MADGRGGPRVPRNPASYSGVGKRSRRTDGRIQPQRVPNIQEGTDLTIGEGQIIKQGQRIAPLGRTPSPQVSPPGGGGGGLPSGGGGADLGALLGMPTNRPMEPETEGLPFGPGGGPEVLGPPDPDDDKIFVLQVMAGPPFNDAAAAQALSDLQSERASRVEFPSPSPQEQIEDEVPIGEEPVTEEDEPAVSASFEMDTSEEIPEEALPEEEMPSEAADAGEEEAL